MIIFAPAKLVKMVEIIVITALIIAIGMAFLLIKVLFRSNGSFSSQHIHDSKAMREQGIHCVMDQDRELRSTGRLAVKERNN